VFKACREYWGDALKDMIKGRIGEGRFGQLVVRPDSGDPEETCVSILKILLEQFKEDVTVTATGHKLLPPYIRVIQGDGVDYITIPKILRRFKDEGIAAANITFGSGGSLLQKVNRDTFKVAFKCSEITVNGEAREVFKDPITDDGKASKKGRLTLQPASDLPPYAPEDVYKPRQGADGVKGGTGFLHFTKDGKYVTVASGMGDASRDLLVDVFENGALLVDWKLGEIRARADVPNGPFSQGASLPQEALRTEDPLPAAPTSAAVLPASLASPVAAAGVSPTASLPASSTLVLAPPAVAAQAGTAATYAAPALGVRQQVAPQPLGSRVQPPYVTYKAATSQAAVPQASPVPSPGRPQTVYYAQSPARVQPALRLSRPSLTVAMPAAQATLQPAAALPVVTQAARPQQRLG